MVRFSVFSVAVPVEVKVVNLPVAGVVAPTGVLSRLSNVMVTPEMLPPVMLTLLEIMFVMLPVVTLAVVTVALANDTVPLLIVTLVNVNALMVVVVLPR